jgi:spore coat protein U-like protein
MKKLALSLAAVAAFAFAPSAAHAQQGQIEVSATIQTILDFGASSALNFGTITPGQAATGQGSIVLSRNVGATVDFPNASERGQLSDGTTTLTPSYTCGIGATATTITTPFTNCSTATLALTAPTGLTTEYVIFNGSLTAAQTNIAPGTYTGVITIRATQN